MSEPTTITDALGDITAGLIAGLDARLAKMPPATAVDAPTTIAAILNALKNIAPPLPVLVHLDDYERVCEALELLPDVVVLRSPVVPQGQIYVVPRELAAKVRADLFNPYGG